MPRVDLSLQIESAVASQLEEFAVNGRDEPDVLKPGQPVTNPTVGRDESAFSGHDASRGPIFTVEMFKYSFVDLLHPGRRLSLRHVWLGLIVLFPRVRTVRDTIIYLIRRIL